VPPAPHGFKYISALHLEGKKTCIIRFSFFFYLYDTE
jgi:hypothetical protein